MRTKIHSYLGFAKRSRNLVTGYNTCVVTIHHKKAKLLILAEDLSENTLKKMKSLADSSGTPYRVYGTLQELSQITGSQDRGIFAITDANFAKVILKEIDN
ncbi:MAG: ribosomal L7Ae/L30e/S12e/Gadd45 family protein [Anaerovorax sp.]